MQDFLYLTEANSSQQVAYTATLLQEAVADWWVSFLKERNGRRPDDFLELTILLEKRFGSSTIQLKYINDIFSATKVPMGETSEGFR